MSLFSKIFFIIFLITEVPAALMTFIFRKREYSFYDLFIQGSFIIRYLYKYVKEQYVKPIQILGYIGLSIFILCVAGILLDIIKQM